MKRLHISRDLGGEISAGPSSGLHPRTIKLLQNAGYDFRLHQHQARAAQAVAEGRTVILSAGTGSGKTESFLIPIIDRLFWDHEQGLDDLRQPGVRAVVIYPLNALVNNQVERLVDILKDQRDISFAYYTSRLPETWSRIRTRCESRGKPLPPTCQIVDRKTLRGLDAHTDRANGPPHILLTNFSMLEYMLIRPIDRTIFSPAAIAFNGRPRLRFVVLDEAHVYAGAQATEIHMLLRRAAERFGTRLENVQGIATSASLPQGGLENGQETLTRFAAEMFAKSSERVSIVLGRRQLPQLSGESRGATLRPPTSPEFAIVPPELRTLELDVEGRPTALILDADLASRAVQAAMALGIGTTDEAAILNANVRDTPSLVLHALLSCNASVRALRQFLFDRDTSLATIDEVADVLYGHEPPSEARRAGASAILALGALARQSANELPLVPVRTHAFVRAPVGAWVVPKSQNGGDGLWPWGTVHADPPGPEADEEDRLELFLCVECGGPAPMAWTEREPGWQTEVLVASGAGGGSPVLLWRDQAGAEQLPVAWGGGKATSAAATPTKRGRYEAECKACGRKRATFTRIALSPRAALGALIDAIYPYLGATPQQDGGTKRPGGGRRLLTFSDSRQEAARVATRVEETHDIGLNRQILWRLLEGQAEIGVRELLELIEDSQFLKERAAANATGAEEREDLANLCVYQELARPPARGWTLETLGLVEVVYPDLPPAPTELAGLLSDTEWRAFLSTVLDDARRRGVVRRPNLSQGARDRQLHQLLPPTIDKRLCFTTAFDPTEDGEDDEQMENEGSDRVPFVPSRDHDRERSRVFSFAARVSAELATDHGPLQLLEMAWRDLVATAKRTKWIRIAEESPGQEPDLRIDLRYLRLRIHKSPPMIASDTARPHFRAVRGVGPDRVRGGNLHPPNTEEIDCWRGSSAVRRVLDEPPLGLWSVEHTAQLDVEELEEQEVLFRKGERNLLASSTTLELGVDIGGLSLVFLTNVPPTSSNYWQRAGRAGRRTDGSSMVITLALARPHDQRVFKDPRAFLGSPVTSPSVRLDLEPLLTRHVNASLLGAFFEEVVRPGERGNPMCGPPEPVDDFIFAPIGERGGIRPEAGERLELSESDCLAEAFTRWLSRLTPEGAYAARIARLTRGTVLEDAPLGKVAADCARTLMRAVEVVRHDHGVITEQRTHEYGQRRRSQG